jgi:hypothetical protein
MSGSLSNLIAVTDPLRDVPDSLLGLERGDTVTLRTLVPENKSGIRSTRVLFQVTALLVGQNCDGNGRTKV